MALKKWKVSFFRESGFVEAQYILKFKKKPIEDHDIQTPPPSVENFSNPMAPLIFWAIR